MDDLREHKKEALRRAACAPTRSAEHRARSVKDAARRLRRCRRGRGGILDCRCARRSAGRQVGTKGWSYSDRTKGWALELNSTALAYHVQFAELDAHNSFHAWTCSWSVG